MTRPDLTHGETCKNARYLGPQVGMGHCVSTEIKIRVQQTKANWCIVGHVWKLHVPWRVTRMFVWALLVNTLVSGLTPFILDNQTTASLTRVWPKSCVAYWKKDWVEGGRQTAVKKQVFEFRKLPDMATELRG